MTEDSEADEDEFELEGFDYDNQIYSNIEFKIWKINERERKKQNLTKISKLDTSKGESKLSSKGLETIQETKNQFTQNTTNSLTSGSTKSIGMRSKLNPNSQAYNINQPRSRAINKTNMQNFHSTNQIMFPQQNMMTRSQKLVSDQTSNYHQIYNQRSNHGIMNPMNMHFQNDAYRMESSNIPNRRESTEISTKFYSGALSTPFSINNKIEPKSKSNLVQNNLRFPSDTKIVSQKSFTLFGENEFDEDHTNFYQHESDSGDEKLAKCIPSDMLEDSDHSHIFNAARKNFITNKILNDKEYDCGSVSSGSDKEGSPNIKVLSSKHSENSKNMRHYDSSKDNNSGSNNSGSTGLGSSKRMYEEFKSDSPEIQDLQKEGKEIHSYNSSKLLSSTSLESKNEVKQANRISNESASGKDLMMNMDQPHPDQMQQYMYQQMNFTPNNHFYKYNPAQTNQVSNQGFPMQ